MNKKNLLKGGIAMLLWAIALTVLLGFCNSCSAQDYVVKGFAWDYDFTAYSDSSIYFILYQQLDGDTTWNVVDTSSVQALSIDIIHMTPFYDFQYRNWMATAVQHEGTWDVINWSFESPPSNTVRTYLKALPPAPIDTTAGFRYVQIKIEQLPVK